MRKERLLIGNRILILSVSVGTGHMRSAEALKKAAEILYPEIQVVIMDTFRYTNPFLDKAVFGTYMKILRIAPSFYGYLYRRSEHGNTLSRYSKQGFNRLINTLTAPKLSEYIKNFSPQIIVCTHPFPLGIVAGMKKRGVFQGALYSTITDFTIHSFWIFPEVDFYIVASEHLMVECEKAGLGKGQILATGIPIDPAFEEKPEKKTLRQRLGLQAGLATILVMGGGLGMGPLLGAVQALDQLGNSCQVIVVTGKNKAVFEKLNRLAPGLSCKIKVLGFVDNIHELMLASDLIVGKAGGLTCAEALAAGLPVFILDPLPGHEERNTEFFINLGAGYRVNERNLAGLIRSCLLDPEKMAGMSKNASHLGKPGAACNALRFMVKNLPEKIIASRHL